MEELRKSIMPALLLCSIVALTTSFYIRGVIEIWIGSFELNDDIALALYSPYDWYTMRWSFSILFGVIISFPLLCLGFYRFMESGLLATEKRSIRSLFLVISFVIPMGVSIIVALNPIVASAVASSDRIEGVVTKIDPISIVEFSLSASWVFTVFTLLVCTLTTTRILISDNEIGASIRVRFHLIFAALLFVAMSNDFRGLRAILIFASAVVSNALSKSLAQLFFGIYRG